MALQHIHILHLLWLMGLIYQLIALLLALQVYLALVVDLRLRGLRV